MKKFNRIAVSALALLLAGATFPACKGDGTVKDPMTLNVKMLKAGWGEEWVYELKAAFEKVYKEEGYKVNIIDPTIDMRGNTVINDLFMGYSKTNTDLYITGDITAPQVGTQNNMETGEALVEDLGELVYNQSAIGFDGAEESVKIKDKLSAETNDWIRDTLSYDSDQKYYGLPYIASNAGLVVNVARLADYGFNETPRTSQEVIDMSTAIYLGANGEEDSYTTDTFPFTYFNNDGVQGGYGTTWMYAMIAQHNYEEYKNLMNFTKTVDGADVDMTKEETMAAYSSKSVHSSLEFMGFAFDPNLASYGSKTQDLDGAQATVMQGSAVFMANGDWFLNEVRANYDNVEDVTFVNYPLNSLIGKEEFGAGTTLNLSDAEADVLLSYIVKLVDENTEIAEIISKVSTEKGKTVTEESVTRIANARGMHYSRGVEAQCYVTKGTTKMDMVTKFLRMMASDDAAKMITTSANGTSMFAKEGNPNAELDFVKSASAISVNKYASPYRWFPGGLRKRMTRSSLFQKNTQMLGAIIEGKKSMFSDTKGEITGDFSIYTTRATELQGLESSNASENWQSWVDKAVK